MTPIIEIISRNLEELSSIQQLLENEGYCVFVSSTVNKESINKLYRNQPDIILLDVEINNSDGIEFCHQLKSENALNSFIVLFSKYSEDYIQIEAFKAGADDYIIRPINHRILLRKISAILKRKPFKIKKTSAKILSHNTLKIDRDSYLVYRGNNSFSLPRKEFEMLYLLINKPQKVFSREEIFTTVWNEEKCLNARIIDVHVRKIREKIGDNIINTVKGVGYQLA